MRIRGQVDEIDPSSQTVRPWRESISNDQPEAKLVEIDKDKVRTQEEEAEPAPIDQVEDRVEAEMREIEERARKSVEEGLKSFDTDRETEK